MSLSAAGEDTGLKQALRENLEGPARGRARFWFFSLKSVFWKSPSKGRSAAAAAATAAAASGQNRGFHHYALDFDAEGKKNPQMNHLRALFMLITKQLHTDLFAFLIYGLLSCASYLPCFLWVKKLLSLMLKGFFCTVLLNSSHKF